MSPELKEAISLIRNMDLAEIAMISEVVKDQRTFLGKQTLRSLIIGDVVQFKGRTGGMITGTVEKVSRKNVVVQAAIGGEKWRVPASMLTKIAA